MKILSLSPWIIYYDDQITRKVYDQIEIGGAETCGCEPCVNFIEARHCVYPAIVLKVLHTLGIDHSKEEEVYHYAKIKSNNLHSYGGRFLFIGKVEYEDKSYRPPESGNEALKLVKVTKTFSWRFSHKIDFIPDVFKQYSLAQIDFEVKIPWLIDKKESD